MQTYPILYINTDDAEHVYGVALPIFIHNLQFHLTMLDIYEDGAVDCWGSLPIGEVQSKVTTGWIDTEPPPNARIHIHNLGLFNAVEGHWNLPRHQIAQIADELFHQLNPGGLNLLDLGKERAKTAAKMKLAEDMIMLARFGSGRHLYRSTAQGQEIFGRDIPVFYRQEGEYILTKCLLYQDGQAQIRLQGELLPIEALHDMLNDGRLMTSIPDGAWLTLPGLGRCQVVQARWAIDPQERWREILNIIGILNGQEDVVEVCHQAFLAYQAEPTEVNRERLRAAYEAVPQHLRLYTERDMDDKDHEIRRILYGPL